jgi:hypothetical protein
LIFRRQQIRARRKKLSELDERGAEFFQRQTQMRGRRGFHQLRFVFGLVTKGQKAFQARRAVQPAQPAPRQGFGNLPITMQVQIGHEQRSEIFFRRWFRQHGAIVFAFQVKSNWNGCGLLRKAAGNFSHQRSKSAAVALAFRLHAKPEGTHENERNAICQIAPPFLRNAICQIAPPFRRNAICQIAPPFLRSELLWHA